VRDSYRCYGKKDALILLTIYIKNLISYEEERVVVPTLRALTNVASSEDHLIQVSAILTLGVGGH
jgi:hypothetical protein